MDIHVHDLHKFPLCVKCGLKRMEQPGQRCEHCTKEKAKAARSLADFLQHKQEEATHEEDQVSEMRSAQEIQGRMVPTMETASPQVNQTCLAF